MSVGFLWFVSFCYVFVEPSIWIVSRLYVEAQYASSPPRGWNSYDSFSWTISEKEFLDRAQFISDRLLSSGYEVGRLQILIISIPFFIFHFIFHQSQIIKIFLLILSSKILKVYLCNVVCCGGLSMVSEKSGRCWRWLSRIWCNWRMGEDGPWPR